MKIYLAKNKSLFTHYLGKCCAFVAAPEVAARRCHPRKLLAYRLALDDLKIPYGSPTYSSFSGDRATQEEEAEEEKEGLFKPNAVGEEGVVGRGF